MIKKTIVPVRKKRMDVRQEHKIKLSNPDRILENGLRFEPITSTNCSKSLSIGKFYYKEGKKTKSKKVVIKELSLNQDYNYLSDEKVPTIIGAIKNYIIKRNLNATPENIAKFYNKTIVELRKAGIELPKMMAIVQDKKVLIISQYFGNKSGSKITKNTIDLFLQGKDTTLLIDLYAKTINAGFIPTFDFVEILKTKEDKLDVLPIDIDQQVMYYLKYGKINKIKDKEMQKKVIQDITRTFIRSLYHNNPVNKINVVIKDMISKLQVDYLKKGLLKEIKKDAFVKYFNTLNK